MLRTLRFSSEKNQTRDIWLMNGLKIVLTVQNNQIKPNILKLNSKN